MEQSAVNLLAISHSRRSCDVNGHLSDFSPYVFLEISNFHVYTFPVIKFRSIFGVRAAVQPGKV